MDWNITLEGMGDAQLAQALSNAHIPALMAALVHVQDSTHHLRGDIQPTVVPLAEDEDGLTETARHAARELALEILSAYRNAGCLPLPHPNDAKIAETMEYITGAPIPDGHWNLLQEELNLFGEDRRQVHISQGVIPTDYRVLIIGAGMSGILAAIRLQAAGINYLMVDKNSEIGGTWFENTYPGCQVDSANHLYNYIFEPNHQWPGHFSSRESLFAYFTGVVERHGVREHTQLNTLIDSAVYEEESSSWTVQFESAEGLTRTEIFSAVISACGQLNTPAFPDIRGIDSFQGVAFHSARWEHQHDLTGKRVAVIGTGCSATQFVPAIVDQPASMTVFQRTPGWLLPMEDYHEAVTEEELWCFRNIPFYSRWYRFFLFRARASDGLLPFFYEDKNWQGQPKSIGAANAELRTVFEEYIHEQAGHDLELANALIPDYPPGGKRPILDDGGWISALKRDHVNLVTTSIEEVLPHGIRTTDGQEHEFDVLIYGTGFHANKFLSSIEVRGRSGRELHETWQNDPQAYMGVTVPGFPNFYLLYGPNTNIVTGSSIIFFSECEMRYIMGCLKMTFENGLKSLEVREDVCRQYNADVDSRNRARAWGSPNVSSWYKNENGRVSQNWPGTHFEWWQQTLAPNYEDYDGN